MLFENKIFLSYIMKSLKYIHSKRETLQTNGAYHSFYTRKRDDLATPMHLKKSTNQFVDYQGVELYNKLPKMMKEIKDAAFMNTVKYILVKRAYYSIEEFLNDCF